MSDSGEINCGKECRKYQRNDYCVYYKCRSKKYRRRKCESYVDQRKHRRRKCESYAQNISCTSDTNSFSKYLLEERNQWDHENAKHQ